MTLTVGELCAGYGGLGRAVEQVFGAELRWYSEFDPAPSAIMAHHWPGVPNLGDMTAVDWAAVEPVDVLSGGTPCQDLSHAGRRAGMTEGTRSNLWVAMREAIAVIRPRRVVWENVRGAYSAAADSAVEFCPGCMGDAGDGEPVLRALGRVLGDLSDLGYDAQWRGLRASDVGAPHARFRVFVSATDSLRG
jgi:DNA (cytosine-5)-methyltransferase 1